MRPEKTKKKKQRIYKERKQNRNEEERDKKKQINWERKRDKKETKKKEKIDAMSFGGRAHFGETQL